MGAIAVRRRAWGSLAYNADPSHPLTGRRRVAAARSVRHWTALCREVHCLIRSELLPDANAARVSVRGAVEGRAPQWPFAAGSSGELAANHAARHSLPLSRPADVPWTQHDRANERLSAFHWIEADRPAQAGSGPAVTRCVAALRALRWRWLSRGREVVAVVRGVWRPRAAHDAEGAVHIAAAGDGAISGGGGRGAGVGGWVRGLPD